ncbi:hypothetical protein AALP_AA4G249100 [Arabis alpina]|uniref:RING-type E3 ubiquitin transferase n=1 Tax=Arabis alpina TaxID=50452 RepID=A0A087H5H5_ARAAL|nr:hypothetical protein AALP_AA4G249100 [Arabis alpina]
MSKPVLQQVVMDERIYVAVGRDLDSKSTLVWAIQNTGGKEFCLVHVRDQLYRKDKEKTEKILDKYVRICKNMQVRAEKIYIEIDSVEKGIILLISERGIKKLVMGAASDRHYSMRMHDLLSAKAIYIRQEAPATCHIWFTCKGYLIHTREAIMGNASVARASTSSDQDSVRTRGSDILSSQSNITKGHESVPASNLVDIGKVYDNIQLGVTKASLELFKLQEVEADKNEIIKRAIKWARSYSEEFKRRKETEMELIIAREALETMRFVSDSRITESYVLVKKLQEKYNLAIELLRRATKDRDELKTERDIAIKEAKKLKNIHEKISRSDKHREAPQYFICPITQEVMDDPQVAADGFTYEAGAISSWLERGHETSPMTNMKLLHTKLVPNLALRSAIQEWLHTSTSSGK